MAQSEYLTAPVPTDKMPPGVPYIVGNEAAERFSFYGMRGILFAFMTKYLMDRDGTLAVMEKPEAMFYYHQFLSAVYYLPVLGAILSDVFLGKYRTIFYLSIVYCFGHLALALDETRLGLFIGLSLIALGSGGIKPCVSANVGDQFGASNQHLLEKVYGWFYFSINFGSTFSTIVTPWLLEKLPGWLRTNMPSLSGTVDIDRIGPHVAFGVPGLLMLLATFVFWLGRYKYVHIPPKGWNAIKAGTQGEGAQSLLRLIPVFLFVAMFWSLYDQSSSKWIDQAERMDRVLIPAGETTEGWTILASQVHTLNPVMIMLFMPLFAYVIYPAINRFFPLTPLRKLGIGFCLTVLSFVVSAFIEQGLDANLHVHIYWQVLSYALLTAGEVMVSITCLEFSYTQAPKEMKSLVMSMYLMSIALGNQFTSLVNYFLQDESGKSRMADSQYYWLFSGMLLLTTIGFIFYARTFQYKRFLQDEATTK